MIKFLLLLVIAFLATPLRMAGKNIEAGRRRRRYRGRSGRRRR